MAAESAGKSIAVSSSRKPFDFSPDSPPRLSLTPDQFKHCSEALRFFKDKLQMPEKIRQEFAFLQAWLAA
ncbi:hypothetical protein CK203_035681 [Vitis vinifera]|uniref:Uncharacterized protein n=2 Tax=Vitis vinifera TaxID=29760 RepID=A5BC32_VITVI|nr:hypothetical protein CK203_035681 [Vitis vinifera]CAN83088.1 hypothetical protein VITISV_005832 [Vitis vinifera]